MKIEVAKRDLEEALQVVSHSMSAGGGDLSTHFLFRVTPGETAKAEVRTHSGRLYAGCPFVATVTESQFTAFTIEGKRLQSWMRSVPDAVLVFEFDGKNTTAKSPKGTQRFGSLDPQGFPHWDINLSTAKSTATLSAARLAEALGYCRRFASDEESRSPQLCVCEVCNGVMCSTDKIAGTYLTVRGLEESTMRVHVKDVAAVLSFLGAISGTVEVLEHKHHTFFRRGDGAICGESRFLADFPRTRKPPVTDLHEWTFPVADLKSSIPFLVSGAEWEDTRLRFIPSEQEDGTVMLSMLNTTGVTTEVPVVCSEMKSGQDAVPVPKDGFVVAHPSLVKVLAPYTEGNVRIGINPREKSGYLRVVETKEPEAGQTEGDQYVTIIAWLR